jgi:DNA primase
MGVALSDEHINILKTLDKVDSIILSFDNDTAGIQATIANGYKLMENGFNTFVVGSLDKGVKDIDELFNQSGQASVDKVLTEQKDFISFFIEHSFQKKLAMNEIQKVANTIIKNMIDFGDVSLLWKTKHLQLIADKTGIAYEDLLTKYNSEFQKTAAKETNITTSSKSFASPYKPTNTIGLKEAFLETEAIEEGKVVPKSEVQELQSEIITDLNLTIKKMIDCYDYIIETLINKPDLLARFNDELWRSAKLEFKEQQTTIKALHALADRNVPINEITVLEFLQTYSKQEGKVGAEYKQAYDYLSYRLSLPYYLILTKQKTTVKGEKQFVDAMRELQYIKYALKIRMVQKQILDLYIEDKKTNADKISDLFGEINGFKTQLNNLLKSVKKQAILH